MTNEYINDNEVSNSLQKKLPKVIAIKKMLHFLY
jgi:hypothetical protein